MTNTAATSVNEAEEKLAYASLLLTERDPFKAALALFPNNTNRALWVAVNWSKDQEVKAEQARLVDEESDSFVLSKRELLQDIEQRMKGTTYPNGNVVPTTADEYAKLAKLYADIRGFIDKPAAVNVNTSVIVPRAIEVPTHGTNEQWEIAAETQQRELLSVSRTKH